MSRRRKLSELLKALIAAMGIIFLLALYALAGAGEIRLKADAEVSGTAVKVGDVAEVIGFDENTAKRIAGASLGKAPKKREVRTVTRKEIELRLQHRGVDMKDVVMTGAQKVEVSRGAASTSINDSPVRRAVKSFLKKHFRKRIRVTILDVDLDAVKGRTGNIFPCAERSITATAEPDEVASGETMFVFVPVRGADGKEVRMAVEVLITRLQTVIRAARNIHRGRMIAAADLSVEDVPADSVIGRTLTRDEVIGAKCSRRIKAGKTLTEGDIILPPAVKKGDKVSIVVNCGGLEVTTSATALEDGAVGSAIRVENPMSKGVYRVTVCGTGKARKE